MRLRNTSTKGLLRSCWIALSIGAAACHAWVWNPAAAAAEIRVAASSGADADAAHLTAYRPTQPPRSFGDTCARHPWACSNGTSPARFSEDALLSLARQVNNEVNRTIHGRPDLETYGQVDYWSLPVNGEGDCEDYAMLKKRELLKAGVPPEQLLLATVLTQRSAPHAVLVLRLNSGDYVLDNLRQRLLTWRRTGFTFLKMQDPSQLDRWNMILLGPLAKRTPALDG